MPILIQHLHHLFQNQKLNNLYYLPWFNRHPCSNKLFSPWMHQALFLWHQPTFPHPNLWILHGPPKIWQQSQSPPLIGKKSLRINPPSPHLIQQVGNLHVQIFAQIPIIVLLSEVSLLVPLQQQRLLALEGEVVTLRLAPEKSKNWTRWLLTGTTIVCTLKRSKRTILICWHINLYPKRWVLNHR